MCNAALLGTTSGTVRLRANFVPEDIDLKWYDENGNRVNTTNASNTCTYDTSINLPSNPTREGYEFNGWKVVWDFSTLDATKNGTSRSITGKNWRVTFPYGTIYGTSICTNQYASQITTSANLSVSSNEAENIDCWCRVTGFQPYDSNITYVSYRPLPWATFAYNAYSNATTCANVCSWSCTNPSANGVMVSVDFRRVLFGQSN